MALETGAARSLLYSEHARNPRIHELAERARAAGLHAEAVDLARLDELTGGGVHQGVLVRLRSLPAATLPTAESVEGPSLVLLLDGITDPQNVGAILRAAVAVGVEVVVLPLRRGALLTPGVHRASSGMSLLARVTAPQNLSQAVRELKDAGYWIVAADAGEGTQPATSFDWPSRTALVLGSEGAGIAEHLLRASDFRVALPMDPRVESLNVGVACGALAYLYRRQWPAPA